MHLDDVWTDTIPFNDPAQAITNGIAELRTLFVMTEDTTVGSNQSWKAHVTPGDAGSARLLDWISPKFGSAFEIRLFDNNDVEIFTTDPVDFFFNFQTGILTFNGSAAGKARPFKITAHRYIGAKGLPSNNTLEDMVIPVDFNDAGAIDPPAGTVFARQSDVDKVLGAAPAFKHTRLVVNAIVRHVEHLIEVRHAAGVQRPDPTAAATSRGWSFDVPHTFGANGQIAITGSAPSTYTALAGLSGLTIDSKSGSTTLGDLAGTNVFLDFSSSHPLVFAGLDLRGLHVTTDTGDVLTIQDHTDDRLFTTGNAGASAATASVARPSTIFRASDDDTPGSPYSNSFVFGTSWLAPLQPPFTAFGGGHLVFNDIRFDTWSVSTGSTAINSSNVRVDAQRCLVDFKVQLDDFGVPPSGRAFFHQGSAGSLFTNTTGVKSTPASGSTFDPYVGFSGASLGHTYGVIYGMRRFVFIGNGGDWFSNNSVVRKTGDQNGSSITIVDSTHFFSESFSFNSGVRNRIQDETLELNNARGSVVGRMQIRIGSQSGPCVKCLGDVNLDTFFDSIGTLRDGGGNTDVGIQVDGSFNNVKLDAVTDVRGSVGDVRFEGSVVTYASLGTVASPTIGTQLNSIGKG